MAGATADYMPLARTDAAQLPVDCEQSSTNSTWKMLRETVIVVCLLAALQGGAYNAVSAQTVAAPLNSTVIEAALQQGNSALEDVTIFINEKLPPTATSEADDLLSNLSMGLKYCESQLRSKQSLSEYSSCVSSLKGLAMATLGELAGKYWPSYARSSASRPRLLW